MLFSQWSFPSAKPKDLLIYFAYPSLINNSRGDVDKAADEFRQYDYVILGAGPEEEGHDDHDKTKAIVAKLNLSLTANIKTFGYIDSQIATASGTSNPGDPLTVEERIGLWKTLGVKGIFFDVFGYDYQVNRSHQNEIVTLAHAQGMPVMVNAWDPDEVFGNAPDPTHNPNGEPAVLGADDYYLSESYQIEDGAYQDPAFWKDKAEKLEGYRANIGFKILSAPRQDHDSNNPSISYDEDQFFYAWYSALLYGHEAIAWGEYAWSASGPANTKAPFRARPTLPMIHAFDAGVTQNGSTHSRRTRTIAFSSSRQNGRVWINTETREYGFEHIPTNLITRFLERIADLFRSADERWRFPPEDGD